MGARKKISAEERKQALKSTYFAALRNVPTSPRKMRLVADLVRGMEVGLLLGYSSSLTRKPLLVWRSSSAQLSLTGKRRTDARPKTVSSISPASSSMVLLRSSVCAPPLRVVATVSVSVRTTSRSLSIQ